MDYGLRTAYFPQLSAFTNLREPGMDNASPGTVCKPGMPIKLTSVVFLAGMLTLLLSATGAAAGIPAWLPRYDLEIHLDTDQHWAHVRQRVTFTNRHQRPADELVFNAHSHYQIPDADIGFLAKMLEILRVSPSDGLDLDKSAGPPLQVRKITLNQAERPFYYAEPVYPDAEDHKPCTPSWFAAGWKRRPPY